MRSFSGVVLVSMIPMALLLGCDSEGGAPPAPELFADPEICDVPCEVVLDSGIEAEGRMLTFTWDVGDGPIEGEERLLHRFEVTGTYEVSVTVSQGGEGATDTVTVRVEPQPKSSVLVDQSGGAVSQGAGTVTVPPDVAPEEVAVELTELPSMQEAAERVLGVERFTALGKAYRVSMPLKTGTAIDIAVVEAAGRDPATLAWLVRLVGRPVLPSDVPPVSSRAPIADYALVPVTRVDDSGAAHGDIFARRQFQLVELSDPPNFATFSADATLATMPASKSRALTTKASAPLSVYVLFWNDPPTGQEGFSEAVVEAVRESYNVLVGQMGFAAPEGTITIVVGALANSQWLGAVYTNDHHTIRLAHTIQTADQVKKVIAHEFFHLIQHLNTNDASIGQYFNRDAWFGEGTAEWAADEVWDNIPGHYHATPVKRFKTRLNQENYKNNLEYQTVGFWKWAESEQAGLIRQIIEHKYLLTHSTVVGARTMVENATAADYLTSLKVLWPTLDFLEFVYDARYEKGFDTDESGTGELWGPAPYLGRPKVVDTDPGKHELIAAELYGDHESNPLKVSFELKQRLTADVLRIGSLDLSGTLHVKFPSTGSAPVDARVLILNAETRELEEDYTVRDLSNSPPEVKAEFDSSKEAVVLLADGRFSHLIPDDSYSGEIEAWIESPCGALPSNVVDASDEDELFAALTSAGAGSAVRLPAGTFTPPIQDWPLPEIPSGNYATQVLVKNLTLVGAGNGQTTLAMRGNEFGSVGLTTFGNVTLRDLTIDAGAFWGVSAISAESLVLCNVTVQSSGADGIVFSQWPDGGDGFLGIYDSTITYLGSMAERHAGMELSCLDQSGNLSVEIRDSNISNWYVGVSYTNYSESSCRTNFSTDCKGFTNNELANVMHTECTPPDCTQFVEECP